MQLLLFEDCLSAPTKQTVEKPVAVEFCEGDRVARKAQPAILGEVIEKLPGNRNKIKWDAVAGNGQQHSTVKDKFLIHVKDTPDEKSNA